MISRTGPRRRRPSSLLPRQPLRATPARAARRGFTLLELCIALTLLVTLAAVMAGSFAGWLEHSRLPEGAQAFQTVLRMARAEAANLGSRLRISFDEQDGQPKVLWEPQPLTAPGVFAEYAECSWKSQIPTDLVRVVRCQRTGDSALAIADEQASGQAGQEQAALQDLTFNPDGTCDSAQIELCSTEDSDARRVVIDLEGQCGTLSACTVYPSGDQEPQE